MSHWFLVTHLLLERDRAAAEKVDVSMQVSDVSWPKCHSSSPRNLAFLARWVAHSKHADRLFYGILALDEDHTPLGEQTLTRNCILHVEHDAPVPVLEAQLTLRVTREHAKEEEELARAAEEVGCGGELSLVLF